MTNVMPTEITPMTDAVVKIVSTLEAVKKYGDNTDPATTMALKAAISPMLCAPKSRLRSERGGAAAAIGRLTRDRP
jgi:hypothetical protein